MLSVFFIIILFCSLAPKKIEGQAQLVLVLALGLVCFSPLKQRISFGCYVIVKRA